MPPSILAAPTLKPSVAIRHKSDLDPVRGPGVKFVFRCHRLVGIWSLSLTLQCLNAFLLSIRYIIFVSWLALISTFTATTIVVRAVVNLSTRTFYQVWNSKTVRQWRKKVVFEFVVVVLGPGNLLVLLLFWPGWFALGFAFWVIRVWLGL